MITVYNGVQLQHAKILARLRRGRARKTVLESEENIPDVTARIHELRELGHNIVTTFVLVTHSDGSSNNEGCYELVEANDKQGELFPVQA